MYTLSYCLSVVYFAFVTTPSVKTSDSNVISTAMTYQRYASRHYFPLILQSRASLPRICTHMLLNPHPFYDTANLRVRTITKRSANGSYAIAFPEPPARQRQKTGDIV